MEKFMTAVHNEAMFKVSLENKVMERSLSLEELQNTIEK